MILDSAAIPAELPNGLTPNDLGLKGKKSKDFYLPTYEECRDTFLDWQKNGCKGEVSGLALFIFNYQPNAGDLSVEIWRNFLQLAANYIADQAIDSLM